MIVAKRVEIIFEDGKTEVYINGEPVQKIKSIKFKHNAAENECTLCLELDLL